MIVSSVKLVYLFNLKIAVLSSKECSLPGLKVANGIAGWTQNDVGALNNEYTKSIVIMGWYRGLWLDCFHCCGKSGYFWYLERGVHEFRACVH